MIVTHFERRPAGQYFSIERVFAAVRRALPAWVECRVKLCRYGGTNPFKLAYNIVEAMMRQAGINHITGDVSYLALLLRKTRTIVTIHDCVGMVRLRGWQRQLYRWWWLVLPVRRSSLVTVVSEQTKRDIMQFTGCPDEKIRIVPDPVGDEFRPCRREFRAAMPVILQVGAGSNKNLGRVAAALRGIPCQLHVVGYLEERDRGELERAGIRYRVSNGLTSEQIVRAYEECDLVMFASTYEGFGMPIIEAQAVGRPVVTSHLEPMVSTAGGAACLVDPYDPESIRDGVLRIIQDPAYREESIRQGLENVKRFRASEIARGYLGVYQEVAPGYSRPADLARERPEILILLATYLPGYKAGGPIRSIANLVETFGDEFQFRIITSDRDHRSKTPYAGMPKHEWVRIGKADVMYLPPRCASIPCMIRIIRQTDPEVLYINSLFSPLFSIVPMLLRWLRLIHPRTVLLAPRGELNPAALRRKVWKKVPFRKAARLVRLHSSVLWHASTQYEARDILAEFFGSDVAVAEPLPVRTACDLPDRNLARAATVPGRVRKSPGCVRIVFLSRICRSKNLDRALLMLKGLRGGVLFTIYGPVEDAGYWEQCGKTIRSLPANIRVEYRGEVPHDQVAEELTKSDLFYFPTQSENYGHVIAEALAAGCPVLISDQTAWRNLEEKGIGWDLPLDAPERFRAVLQRCIDMGPDEFAEFSERARLYAVQHSADHEILLSNRELLNFAVRYPYTEQPVAVKQYGI